MSTDLIQVGVWVTDDEIQGLVVSSSKSGLVAVRAPGRGPACDFVAEEFLRPAPMPEPPLSSILELPMNLPVIREVFSRFGEGWYSTYGDRCREWTDLNLGTPERPVTVVRWGR